MSNDDNFFPETISWYLYVTCLYFPINLFYGVHKVDRPELSASR